MGGNVCDRPNAYCPWGTVVVVDGGVVDVGAIEWIEMPVTLIVTTGTYKSPHHMHEHTTETRPSAPAALHEVPQ